MTTKKKTRMLSCPLCGGKFPLTAEICHSCGTNRKCVNIICPYCRYEFVVDSAVWNSLVSVWKSLRNFVGVSSDSKNGNGRPGETSLDMEKGRGLCEVASLKITEPSRLAQLVSYGLFPGMRFTILKKKPSLILQMGETELALDRDLARQITVRPL